MSRQTTVNLEKVFIQAWIQEEYWSWMSDGSFAQTSVISRQHVQITGGVFAWHNTCTRPDAPVDRTNPTCWWPQTKRACLFLTFPFGMILAWLGRESCQFLLGAPRPVVHSGSARYGSPRLGTGSEWALLESSQLLHLLLKVDSEKISSLPNGGGSWYARKLEQTPEVKPLFCSHKRFWVQEKEAFAGHRVCELSHSRHVGLRARRCVPTWYARCWSRVTAISWSSLRPFLFASHSAISPTFLFRKGWSIDKNDFGLEFSFKASLE